MASILSHPFRLAGGRIAVVEQFSDQANAEQLAVLLLTRRGERPLVPTFGVADPTFDALDVGDVLTGIEAFGPEVALMDVETRFTGPMTQEVVVTYE